MTMHGVLPVRHEQALFEHEAVDVVAPHRQAAFEAELDEVAVAVRVGGVAGALAAADLETAAVARRTCSARWLNITVRPSGAGSAAISRP